MQALTQQYGRAGKVSTGTTLKLGSSGVKSQEKQTNGCLQDVGRVVIVALIISNIVFLFLQNYEDPNKSNSLINYSSSTRSIATFKKDLKLIFSDEYEKFAVRVERKKVLKGHGLQSFVLYSSYRTGLTTFAALGLAAVAFRQHRRADNCSWHAGNDSAPVEGSVSLHYPGEVNRLRYETLILICNLTRAVDSTPGGQLSMRLDGSDVTVYRAPAGGNSTASWSPKTPPRYTLTHCSPAMAAPLHPERLSQWLAFHAKHHRVQRFVLYDGGGVGPAMTAVLAPLVGQGQVEVVDARQVATYDSWSHAQVLLANDCLYRTKFVSEWSLFLDFDEYLSLPSSSSSSGGGAALSLAEYLQGHVGKPWISFGSVFFSVVHCSRQKRTKTSKYGALWAVERLIFRDSEVHCKNVARFRSRNLCLEFAGHRKYVLQPGRVTAVQVHRVMNPARGGMDASTDDLRLNHFRGLAAAKQVICRFLWDNGTSPPRLGIDTSVAQLIADERQKEDVVWFSDQR